MHVTLNSWYLGYSKCLISNDYYYYLIREGLAHSHRGEGQSWRERPNTTAFEGFPRTVPVSAGTITSALSVLTGAQ